MSLVNLIKTNLNQEYAKTANGANALSSTLNDHLDIFFNFGIRTSFYAYSRLENCNLEEFLNDFIPQVNPNYLDTIKRALLKDYQLFLRLALYARDRSKGLGERKISKALLYFAAKQYLFEDKVNHNTNKPKAEAICFAIRNLKEELGRWDDIIEILYNLYLFDSKRFSKENNIYINLIYEEIQDQFNKDISANYPSLLAKWLPSENASKDYTIKQAKFVRKHILNLNSQQYRIKLSSIRKKLNLIENYLRSRDYSFDYSKIPGKALMKYIRAFYRNDEERYLKFKEDLKAGLVKAKTDNYSVFDIGQRVINDLKQNRNEKDDILTDLWYKLPDLFENKSLDAIVACDVSSSMYSGKAIVASISLAVYIAQRNKGRFHNTFIDFCGNSRLHQLDENMKDIHDIFKYVSRSSLDMSTNIESVMINALLNTAIRNNLPKEEMPKYVIIISDMQFNECCNCRNYTYDNNDNKLEQWFLTNYQLWQNEYKEAGYDLPTIVFWNANSGASNGTVPAAITDKVIMISGNSQNAIKSIMLIDDMESYEEIPLVPVYTMIETVKDYQKYLEGVIK